MGLFERQYPDHYKGADGQPIRMPPSLLLRQMGPVLPATLVTRPERAIVLEKHQKPIPASITGLALIDTGASVSAISEEACSQLCLKPTGFALMHHAGGIERRYRYSISIHFPAWPEFVVPMETSVVSCKFSREDRKFYVMLLGRDLLANLKFTYNGPAGRIELAC
jgi:hypothetical protein